MVIPDTFIVMKKTTIPDVNMETNNISQDQSKTCFVIMPISDTDGYDKGHFDRVYDYLIKPACEQAGFKPIRADKNQKANFIVIDILKQILNSDMAICDLSSRNSNVFFELGMRQAFNLKTVLIKDTKTPRSFDIAGLRCIDYSESLRVDEVKQSIEAISKSLTETFDAKDEEVNSLIQLLAVEGPAKLPDRTKISSETNFILAEIQRLREEIISSPKIIHQNIDKQSFSFVLPNGELAELGTILYKKNDDLPFYEEFGKIRRRKKGACIITRPSGESVVITDDDDIWKSLTIKDSFY